MMKLRSKRSTQRQDHSPFLPQTEPNETRPRLKFDSPEKTEEWLAKREKTDYTYSRSVSYSSSGAASGYDIPIMSRVSQGAFLRDTSSPLRHSSHLQQQDVAASPNRRSSRLAKKTNLGDSSLVSRHNQSQTRSVQVTRNTSHVNTSLVTASSHGHYDNEAASEEETVWPSSSSTMASSASHMARISGEARRSGMYHQVSHTSNRQHSINHMFGLDANEESELSDTESSSAVTSGGSSRTSDKWSSIGRTDHAHHTHHTQSSSFLHLPVVFFTTVVTSIVSVITTVTYAFYSSVTRLVHGSSVDSVSIASTDSLSSRIVSAGSRIVQLISLAVYRCVTYLMCMDVWWLIFTKRTTLGILGFLGSLVGLGSAGQADRSAAAMTSAMLQERQRKRRSCCLCLLLLLGAIASSYLLMAAAPLLLAAVSKNETKVDSPLHVVNKQLGILLGRLGSTSDDDEGASAFIAGSGCLNCLKQDDLTALIGILVKGQLGDLQSEIASQKQLILAMQQSQTEKETKIHNLQEQMGFLIAQQGQPNDHTLLYINTMEGQLSRVRGQLRSLQLSRLRGYQESDSESDRVEGSTIVIGLSDDLKTLSKEVATLQTDLESFHSQQLEEVDRALKDSKSIHGDLRTLHASMLTREENLAINVTFMEAKLKGLVNDVDTLKSDDKQSSGILAGLVERINAFEEGFVDVKTEVRNLKSEFGELLVVRDTREKETAEAVELSFEHLRNDFASLRVSNSDTVKSLNELQNKYQTLVVSLNGVQTDVNNLQASLQDLSSKQVGVMVNNMQQLNNKLAKLDADVSSLQANFLTLQDTSSGMVDKSGFESLHLSVTQTEEQLNVFTTDIDSLKIQMSQLRSHLDDVRTSHEEHRSQAGAALRELKTDIGELNIKSDRMVVLENTQGTADSESLVKQLSEELGAVRQDLRRVSSLEGNSDLVSEVNNLRSSLTSAKSQINYFDTTQMQMTRTFSSSISDLRDDVAQVNRAAREQSSAITSLNATVVILQQGQDKLKSYVTQQELEDLKVEMVSIRDLIDKLSSAQSVYASTGDVNDLKLQLTNIKSHVDATQVHLSEMSGSHVSDSASYSGLAADLAKMQGTVTQLEAMLYNTDHQPINLNLLDSRISSLTSVVEDNDENLAALLAMGDAKTSGSTEAVIVLQQELATVKSDMDHLRGLFYPQGVDSGESTNTMAALFDRTAAVEASILQMTASGLGSGESNNVRFQKLQGEIHNLREDMMRQNAQYNTGDNLGVLGAAYLDDMKEVKANISNLQVDVYKCCKNKTGLLGWWNSPWFTKGQGSSGSNVNLSVNGNMDEEAVKNIVLSALSMYSADKTGMVDYALESAGGSVISTRCSETHYSKTALLSIFGIPLWYMANSPRTVIQPDVQPGNCWAFKGTQGYIVIQLAGIIKPSAFSMEHIPKSLSPTGTIDSAPKEFSVWGLVDEDDTTGFLLGEYIYDQDGSPLQFFAIEKDDVQPIPAVELKIHSNHGNLEYTCLYRFRVHGTLDRR